MPLPVTIYGLAACDTTRAARKWLEGRAISYTFHDVREDGLSRKLVEGWIKQLGWQRVVNKASTTWRALPVDAREGVDQKAAIELLLAHPTLLKRPLLDKGGRLDVGFKPDAYASLFE